MVRRIIIMLVLITALPIFAVEFSELGKNVVTKKLSNGATLLLLEDHSAPIVHCVTLADVGGVNETPGISGIAHFLEHLAFKGTTTVGTTDYESEKLILDQQDVIFDKILKARELNDEKLENTLQAELDALDIEASKFVINNEFSGIYKENGGRNFNAATAKDFTYYQVSLPSNKLELWFSLETDRFTNPVFRELYKERNIITEERLMREVNSAQGKLISKMYDVAYNVHPYKIPTIGYQRDIDSISRQDVKDFFFKYYGAKNLTFVLYGDFEEKEAVKLAEKYIETIAPRTKTPAITVKEPKQTAERQFSVEHTANPMIIISYHVPEQKHNDNDYVQALAYVLGQSATSPLNRVLVEEKKIAMGAFAFSGLPGSKYENLFSIMCIPNQGVSTADCIKEIDLVVSDFLKNGTDSEAVNAYKKNSKAQAFSQFDTGIYLAIQLAQVQASTGNFQDFFKTLENIEKVNSIDIMRVANKYLTDSNRTVGTLENAGE